MSQVTTKLWRIPVFSIFCLSLATVVTPSYAAAPEARQALTDNPTLDYAPGSVLVKFKPAALRAQKQQAYDAVGGGKIRGYGLVKGLEHIRLGNGVTPEQAAERLGRLPFVDYAEPDYVRQANLNDTFYDLQWGLDNTGQDIRGVLGTPGADIDAELAWTIETGNPAFVVAVIDTGTDYTHPDLDANIWINPVEIADNGVDDDGNGYIDDIHGYDFWGNDADPMDGSGHGTHVAGTICAESDNGVGVAGVVSQCQIMALRFLGPNGGYTSDAIAALNYAVDKGVAVSNNSWGGGGFSQGLYDAIQSAGNNGHLFVAAAGNDNVNTDNSAHYPSSYNLDTLISVAATDNRDQRSSFSNYGAVSVDVGAPGTNIASTYPDNRYVWMSGTSMAAPHVTGLAALIWSSNPDWTPLQVRARIFSSVRPLDALAGKTSTGGIINAHNALFEPVSPPDAPSNLSASAASDTEIDLAWTDNAGNEEGFKIERRPDGIGDWVEIATAAMDATGYTDTALDPDTTYSYRVSASNSVGDSVYSNTADATTDPTPTSQTVVASAENPGGGTVDGSYQDTGADDGVSQSITERLSGGKRPSRYSYLEHTWIFEVPPGMTTLTIDAAWSPSDDGDSFEFSYSLDGNVFTAMADTSEFPANANGTVYIRVNDTDHTPGNQTLDTVSVDYIAIVSAQEDGDPPAAPTGLSATAVGAGEVDLAWTDNSGVELGFEIYRSPDDSSWVKLTTVGAGTTAHADMTVSAETTYYYRVRAHNGSGYSDYSNVEPATTDVGSGIDLTANGFKVKGWQNVDLDWGDDSTVDIYRNNAEIVTDVAGPVYTDPDIAKGGAAYTYQVCIAGTTDCSNEVQVVF